MIKGYVRYCDRCGVELTKANNTCGFELCDKCNEALEQQLAIKNNSSELEKNSKKLEKGTAKNNLGVDCISREATVKRLCNLAEYMNEHKENSGDPYIMAALFIQDNKTEFPSVTPQEPQTFKWCTDCKEYDQEKHCCHRWSKVIRDTVEEMKQEQEPILDKIRAEIEQLPTTKCTETCEIYIDADDFKKNVLVIIDKYKAESEDKYVS